MNTHTFKSIQRRRSRQGQEGYRLVDNFFSDSWLKKGLPLFKGLFSFRCQSKKRAIRREKNILNLPPFGCGRQISRLCAVLYVQSPYLSNATVTFIKNLASDDSHSCQMFVVMMMGNNVIDIGDIPSNVWTSVFQISLWHFLLLLCFASGPKLLRM